MTWEGLTDGLDAHLNTFMSLSPADDGCWPSFIAPGSSMLKLSRSEASSTRGRNSWVSVLPFYLKTEEDLASET
jgi:hypothetical protein